MSAQLYSGVKSLHLVLDTPYDTIRTSDIRDDIVGLKVWYSTTSGFNPQLGQGTLVFDGSGLSVIIPNLTPSTVYYVKYAFISAIDPTTYTVSSELTQTVYNENTTIYGYLSNDPVPIATDSNGAGGNFSNAKGIFKVFNVAQDVTGQGIVYGIKAGSNNNVIGATINATTGAYSCTGIDSDNADITFTASYSGVVIEQVWNVYKAAAGKNAPLVQLWATNTDFVYKDQYAADAITPQTTITVNLLNLPGITPVFTTSAFTRTGTALGAISFTQNGANSIVINKTQFGALGITLGYVIVSVTAGTVTDTITIYRINDGTEQITVELSNEAHVIPAASDGSVAAASYTGSGTRIKVKQGNTYLAVDPTAPYDSVATWNIFNITSVGITCDTTPTIGADYIDFDTHAAMTADQAYIDYTINYRTTSGTVGSQTVRQSFAKSKAGVVGSSAPVVTLISTGQIFTTQRNTGTLVPSTVTLTASAINLGANPTYVWKYSFDSGTTIQTSSTTSNILNWPAFASGTTLIRVEATGDERTAYDQLTLYSVKEGDDTLTASLENENQTVSCDSTGTPLAGQFPLASKLVILRGNTQLTSANGVTWAKVSETGMTSSIVATTGVISITAISAVSASATYSVTVGGVTLNKVFTLSKSNNGINGARTTQLELYRWSATYPTTFPSGTSTYTWATGAFTDPGTLNGWSQNAGVGTAGQALFVVRQNYSDTVTTATSTITWSANSSTPIGSQGLPGTRTAVLELYNWSPTYPTFFPFGTATYTWATGQFTGPTTLNGWSQTPGTGTPGWRLYIVRQIYSDSGTTATSTVTWNSTNVLPIGQNGQNGARTAVLELYQWSAAKPTTAPRGTSNYEWATGIFTAPTTANGWTLLPGASTKGYTLWAIRVVFADNNTSTNTSVTWDSVAASNSYIVGSAGVDGTNGIDGLPGPSVDISGLTSFYKSSGGTVSPATATLTASLVSVTNPTYTWTITGATPTSSTASSVVITPTGLAATVAVTLTVNGSNLTAPITINRGIAIVNQGAPGQAGQNGVMGAYPTIYQWTSGATPTRPTTTSTYTWATGAFTAPAGWTASTAPQNTTSGWYLWEITVPLNVTADTVTSVLNWTNPAYTIRAVTANGTPGTTGARGTDGTNGTPGSATYLINRGGVNSSSQPTDAEVLAAVGRYQVAGDIATISYNSASNSVAYRSTANGSAGTWALQTSYITGSLIVQNSITGDRITANSLSVDKITSGTTGVSVLNIQNQLVTGNFALGSGQRTTMGNTAAIGSFTCSTNTGWALAGFNNNTTAGDWGNGILAGTSSPGGAAIGCYSVSEQQLARTNLKYAAVLAETGAGGYAIGMKTSSYYQTVSENNLAEQYRRVYAGMALPNYGLRAEVYGNLPNIFVPGNVNAQNLAVVIGEIGYCSDDQTSNYAAMFIRRHTTGTKMGYEASRVLIAPSWAPTRAIEVSGGGNYEGTVGHFPGGITSFTGVHESQSAVELTVGDIVVDTEILERQDIANVFSRVVPSSAANDTKVFGIVAHNEENFPIPFLPDDDSGSVPVQGFIPSSVEIFKELEPWKLRYTVLVNGLGEGQVNVCGESGDINAGDLIVTSSISGKGMRQSDDIIRSYTVAKARESVVFDSPTQVKMIACTYLCG